MAALLSYFMEFHLFNLSLARCTLHTVNTHILYCSIKLFSITGVFSVFMTNRHNPTVLLSMATNGDGGEDKREKREREEGISHFALNLIILSLTNSLIYNLVSSFPTIFPFVPHSDPSPCFPPESDDSGEGDIEPGEEGGERKRRNTETMEIDESEEKELLDGGNSTTSTDMNDFVRTRDISIHDKSNHTSAQIFLYIRLARVYGFDTSALATFSLYSALNHPFISGGVVEGEQKRGRRRKPLMTDLPPEAQALRRAALKAKRQRKRERNRTRKQEELAASTASAGNSPANTTPPQTEFDLRSKLNGEGKTNLPPQSRDGLTTKCSDGGKMTKLVNGGSNTTPEPAWTPAKGGHKGKGKSKVGFKPRETPDSPSKGSKPTSSMEVATHKPKKSGVAQAPKPKPPRPLASRNRCPPRSFLNERRALSRSQTWRRRGDCSSKRYPRRPLVQGTGHRGRG